MSKHEKLAALSLDEYIAKFKTLSSVFNAIPAGIFSIVDENFKIVFVNSAAGNILESDVADVIGKTIYDVFGGHFLVLQKLVESTVEARQPIHNFNLEIEDITGTVKTFLASTVVRDTQPGPGLGVILVLHDVTELTRWRKAAMASRGFGLFIGSSEPMKEVYSLIETVAQYDTTVLIYGETGTGTELVARTIHQHSNRSSGPFVPVHCSALASTIFESELFGHIKGSFTGATEDRLGRFEMARGGTLFLDEISTLSVDIQIKLLRAIQERAIERVGSSKTIPTDVRIISATNQDLLEKINDNLFRNDLYYRLKVFQISLPPLRERQADIPYLAEHFVDNFNKLYNRNVLGLSATAKDMLLRYRWPGNVRELENAIEHAMVLASGSIIKKQYFPTEIRNMLYSLPQSLTLNPSALSEEHNIRQALISVKWSVSKAADVLGMHRTTLWRKMRQLGIERS